MRVGVLIEIFRDTDVDAKFAELRSMGMESCQLVCWDKGIMNQETADKVREGENAAEGHYICLHDPCKGCGYTCGIYA